MLQRSAATLGICFLAGCALLAGAVIASADGTPRRLYRDTHVGVAPSDLVVLSLTTTGSQSGLKFFRVQPDGSIGSSEFAVPNGQRLVITDVDWSGNVPTALIDVLRIWVENKTTSSTRNVVYMRGDPAYYSTTSGGSYTNSAGSSGTFTGFSVSSAARLTADVTTGFGGSYPAFSGQGSAGFTVVLRGYLVPDA